MNSARRAVPFAAWADALLPAPRVLTWIEPLGSPVVEVAGLVRSAASQPVEFVRNEAFQNRLVYSQKSDRIGNPKVSPVPTENCATPEEPVFGVTEATYL